MPPVLYPNRDTGFLALVQAPEPAAGVIRPLQGFFDYGGNAFPRLNLVGGGLKLRLPQSLCSYPFKVLFIVRCLPPPKFLLWNCAQSSLLYLQIVRCHGRTRRSGRTAATIPTCCFLLAEANAAFAPQLRLGSRPAVAGKFSNLWRRG